MNKLLGLFAFAIFCTFLGILLWKVPRLDLLAVVGITVALAGWDMLQTMRQNRR